MIEGDGPVGEHRRVVHGGGRHERADPDGFGHRSDGRKDRPHFVDVAVLHLSGFRVRHVVVGEPKPVVPEIVGRPGEIEYLVGRSGG